MENNGWNWKHPSIQESFYQKIPAPATKDDARIRMNCHQHAIKDFDLQIEMNQLEMDILMDNGEVLPYNEQLMDELQQKKLKLLVGKRFHQNASNAYWYHLEKMAK
jgi:hypothetical protein